MLHTHIIYLITFPMKPNFKAIVSICLLGSSLFASSFSFAAENTFPQQAPKQDLSVFVQKLSSRIQEVFGELIDLWRGTTTLADSANGSGRVFTGDFLVDIKWHAHEDDINVLVQYGVVNPYQAKFYPDNYLRRYEMAIMYVKYQLVKGHTQLPEIVFPSLGRYADVAQNAPYASYVAYGTQQNRFTMFVSKDADGRKLFKPNAFMNIDEILRLMNIPVNSWTAIKIKRGEFAHLLVKWSVDGLFADRKWESLSGSAVDTDVVPDWDSPVLDWNQVVSTLKTLFAFVK